MIANLDRERFEPHVFCPPGRAAELFREAGATVHEGTVAAFTHIWASTYRGRRWLLFARELARLPVHVVELKRVLRAQRFDLVHLNDSPMIPAAWLARRARIPVVWHLRSAPPAGGRDRRSRLVRRALLRLADGAHRDQRRCRGALGRAGGRDPERRRARPLSSRRRGRGRRGVRPAAVPPGRLVFRFRLPVQGLSRVHPRGGDAHARARPRRDVPRRRRRRPQRGVLPEPFRPGARAARARTRLRSRGARARAASTGSKTASASCRSRRTSPTCTARAPS